MSLAFFKDFFRSSDDKAVVLMYHRITKTDADPWQLAVDPANFEEQLMVLTGQFHVISIDELVSSIQKKKIRRNSVCITFDDGYADNFSTALPLLQKYNCPASFFITTGNVITHQSFWWDELQKIILHTLRIPSFLSLAINDTLVEFRLSGEELSPGMQLQNQQWIWNDKAPNERCALYLSIWKLLQPLAPEQIAKAMLIIRQWAGSAISLADDQPMTSANLQFFQPPLFTVGAHTINHPALAFHSRAEQEKEIAGSRNYLRHAMGYDIRFITYPYGIYNGDTLALVASQQFRAGFTTSSEAITINSDPFQLGRFQVMNKPGSQFEEQLREWFK